MLPPALPHRSRVFGTLVGLAMLLGATACGTVDSFRPVTREGGEIVGLFQLELLLSALLLALVVGLIVVSLVRFRARPGQGEPPQVEGNRALEIGWTAAALGL